MQPIDVYLTYCAMKAHFSSSGYDFSKYDGKTKVSRNSFWKRNDRIFFAKLSRKYNDQEIKEYLLANFVKDEKGWVGGFNERNFKEWKNKMQRLTHIFEQEVTPLLSDFKTDGKKLFTVPKGSHPKLLKEYLGKRVSAETMVILDKIMDYSSNWDIQMEDDMIWSKVKTLLNNYKKLLTFDKKECKMILINLTNME